MHDRPCGCLFDSMGGAPPIAIPSSSADGFRRSLKLCVSPITFGKRTNVHLRPSAFHSPI
jgi:hypothetical protein